MTPASHAEQEKSTHDTVQTLLPPTARDLIAQQNPHARSAPANKPWAPPHLFPSLSPSLVLETHRENNLWNLRRSEEAHLFSPHVLPTPHPA